MKKKELSLFANSASETGIYVMTHIQHVVHSAVETDYNRHLIQRTTCCSGQIHIEPAKSSSNTLKEIQEETIEIKRRLDKEG